MHSCFFHVGVEAILCTPEADAKRKEVMKKNRYCGAAVAAKAFNIEDSSDVGLIQQTMEEAHFDRLDRRPSSGIWDFWKNEFEFWELNIIEA